SLSPALQDGILRQIKRFIDRFDSERAAWTAASSEREWRLARLSAVVLEQCARVYLTNYANGYRDRCMADNVAALLEAEGAETKAVLLAHNGHVMRTPIPRIPH